MQTAIIYNGIPVYVDTPCTVKRTYCNGIFKATKEEKVPSEKTFTAIIPGCKSVYKTVNTCGTYYLIRK